MVNLYRDRFYRLRVQLQGHFQNNAAGLTPNQVADKVMSQVRRSVKWVSGNIINYNNKLINFFGLDLPLVEE